MSANRVPFVALHCCWAMRYAVALISCQCKWAHNIIMALVRQYPPQSFGRIEPCACTLLNWAWSYYIAIYIRRSACSYKDINGNDNLTMRQSATSHTVSVHSVLQSYSLAGHWNGIEAPNQYCRPIYCRFSMAMDQRQPTVTRLMRLRFSWLLIEQSQSNYECVFVCNKL